MARRRIAEKKFLKIVDARLRFAVHAVSVHMANRTRPKRIDLHLNEDEEKILKAWLKRIGCESKSDFFRRVLRCGRVPELLRERARA